MDLLMQIGQEVQWIGKVPLGTVSTLDQEWCNRKQKFVALSSSEKEYMAASTTSCEAISLRKLLVNLFKKNMEATRIMCNNQSCIKLSENPLFHDRSNHIDIRSHFV